jgi:hypothetical protein
MKHKYCFQVYLRLLLGNVHTDEYFVVFPTVLLLFRIQTLPEDGQPMSLYGQVGNSILTTKSQTQILYSSLLTPTPPAISNSQWWAKYSYFVHNYVTSFFFW